MEDLVPNVPKIGIKLGTRLLGEKPKTFQKNLER
jgi:hypothetical protein